MLNQKNACLMHATYRCTCNLCLAEQDEQKIGCLVVHAGVRVLLQISVPFTPLSTFRFQPLPAVVTHGVDVDITFHYVTSQFSAFGRLGVARRSLALLGDIDACKSRRSQISALLGVPWRCSATSMLASLDVHRSQRCSQDSQRW